MRVPVRFKEAVEAGRVFVVEVTDPVELLLGEGLRIRVSWGWERRGMRIEGEDVVHGYQADCRGHVSIGLEGREMADMSVLLTFAFWQQDGRILFRRQDCGRWLVLR